MSDNATTISDLKKSIKKFIGERNWEEAHSPKNISMSLAIEVGELMEHFQWISEKQSLIENISKENLEEIKDELADVAIYLLDLCDVLKVDLSDAIRAKMIKNAKKYPVGSVLVKK